jgi:hypothetical protein
MKVRLEVAAYWIRCPKVASRSLRQVQLRNPGLLPRDKRFTAPRALGVFHESLAGDYLSRSVALMLLAI